MRTERDYGRAAQENRGVVNIDAIFSIIIGVLGVVSLILKHALSSKGSPGGTITDSVVLGPIKGRDVRLEQIFQTINQNSAAHGPNDLVFSKPAYEELVRYGEELKRKDRDLTAALGRIQQLQADIRRGSRRDRVLLAVGWGAIGLFLGWLIALLVNSQSGGALAGVPPEVSASSVASPSSNATTSMPTEAPASSALPSAGAPRSPIAGGPAAEGVIEQYFDFARQKNPAGMRTLTTDRFVDKRSKGPEEFDKWWSESVVSVQSAVSPGRAPILHINGDADAVWVQVAWRYTTKSSGPMSVRKWKLMWFKMVPSESGYLLDELKNGVPKNCDTDAERLMACVSNDEFVI